MNYVPFFWSRGGWYRYSASVSCVSFRDTSQHIKWRKRMVVVNTAFSQVVDLPVTRSCIFPQPKDCQRFFFFSILVTEGCDRSLECLWLPRCGISLLFYNYFLLSDMPFVGFFMNPLHGFTCCVGCFDCGTVLWILDYFHV